jgi:hypothetical protein
MTHAEGTWDLDSLQAITLRHQPASGNRTLKIQKKNMWIIAKVSLTATRSVYTAFLASSLKDDPAR